MGPSISKRRANLYKIIEDGNQDEVWKAVVRAEDHEIPWRVLWVQDGRGMWLSWEVGGIEELRKVLGMPAPQG
ncbi:MAG: hypothetical protein M3Y56_10600 [Armatimonadota bacterium]|nr:hypothetical protein [Armatimonadota bacterium]